MTVCNVKYCKEAVKPHLSHNSINSHSSSMLPLSLLPCLYIFGWHYFYTKGPFTTTRKSKYKANLSKQHSAKLMLYSYLSMLFQPFQRHGGSKWAHSSDREQFLWRRPHRTQREEWLWSKESAALSLFSATRYRLNSCLQTVVAARKRLLFLLRFAGAAQRRWEKSSFPPWWHKTVSCQNLSKHKIKIITTIINLKKGCCYPQRINMPLDILQVGQWRWSISVANKVITVVCTAFEVTG